MGSCKYAHRIKERLNNRLRELDINYIKSPLNYVGGKYKLLNQIIPAIPTDTNRFVDVFGGGFNVGINVQAKMIIYNDTISEVVQLLQLLNDSDTDDILHEIDKLILKYELSKTNQDGYLKLRKAYNDNKSPVIFYVLVCYAFNYQIRFNSKGMFNMPFGKNRSSFNPALRNKFCIFVDQLHNKNCKFFNKDFRELKIETLKNNDFIYCDPPYLNTTASYNENKGWTERDECSLRDMITLLHRNNIKFGLSNNATTNTTLLEWAKDNNFYIYHLNINYKNCNYQKKARSKDDEVYITNVRVSNN